MDFRIADTCIDSRAKRTISSHYHEIRRIFMVNEPDLKLERIVTVSPGEKRFTVAPKVEAVPLSKLPDGKLFDGAE